MAMEVRVEAAGTASRDTMWDAYADPSRWRSWAPQIRSVEPHEHIREGLEGTVTGLLGVRARFRVLAVERDAGRWSWEVRTGPVRLRIDHEVDDGRASITIEGPAPAVLAYAPVARLALSRLVRLP
jgi:hypothetical protein